MRRSWPILSMVILICAARAAGQYDGPAEMLHAQGSKAWTWNEGQANVVLLEGPVSISIDKNQLSARSAVMWISSARGTILDQDRAEIALIGDAKLVQPNGVTRSGPRLFVDARIRGSVRITAPRAGGDRSDDETYRIAASMRPMPLRPGEPGSAFAVEQDVPLAPATRPTAPTDTMRPSAPVYIHAATFSTVKVQDGTIAAIFPGKIALTQTTAKGDVLELQAEKAVVFTPLTSMMDLPATEHLQAIEEGITGVYLEGDVRISRTPANTKKEAEQRLTAQRAFYDFTTDRAVMTDVVMYTSDTRTQIPIVVRARLMRQLSSRDYIREYTTEKAQLTSSTFHTPSFSIGASSTYMKQTELTNEITGVRTGFVAHNATFNIGGVPVFYLPMVAGTVTERSALRSAEISSSGKFGFGVSSNWGLFESFGRLPPKDLDASYTLGYFTKRGPVLGLDAKYLGGFVNEGTLEPWSFTGDLTSFLVWDEGKDDLGRRRDDVDPAEDLRGRVLWRHQHFFPNDWQVQVMAGYVSDPTFLEQWFNRDFRNNPPSDISLYVKRQRESEALTFLLNLQPADFVTTADLYQEQFEVQHLPEFGYRRIGDSILDDNLTFFSENTFAGLRFDTSSYDLESLGFRTSPGMPSLGIPYKLDRDSPIADIPDQTTYRADLRQELDWPIGAGKFRLVPYVVGRYTEYTESLGVDRLGRVTSGGYLERLLVSTGVRSTTSFWRVDDTVESEIFDLHRLRHVIEPELHLFASAQTHDRDEIYIYEEQVDDIAELAAVSYALNQRWQTKRGGPGNWRSVDFFQWNSSINYFFSQPSDRELFPTDFRGFYYVSRPESSIPRHSFNTNANWAISDAVSIYGDMQWNLDSGDLATGAIGYSVRQDPRLAYHVELRHIALDIPREAGVEINGWPFVFDDQDLLIFASDYELTRKYRLNLAHSYDLAQNRNYRSAVTLIRHFDRFYVAVGARVDRLDGDNAIFFNVWPEGLEPGGGSQALRGFVE